MLPTSPPLVSTPTGVPIRWISRNRKVHNGGHAIHYGALGASPSTCLAERAKLGPVLVRITLSGGSVAQPTAPNPASPAGGVPGGAPSGAGSTPADVAALLERALFE